MCRNFSCSVAPTSMPAASGSITGRLCRLTLLLALLFFLRIAFDCLMNGAGSARRRNRFTNLSNGVEPPS
jgi:hypothetical protein